MNAALNLPGSTMQVSQERVHAVDVLHLVYAYGLAVRLEVDEDHHWRCRLRNGSRSVSSGIQTNVCTAVAGAVLKAGKRGWFKHEKEE